MEVLSLLLLLANYHLHRHLLIVNANKTKSSNHRMVRQLQRMLGTYSDNAVSIILFVDVLPSYYSRDHYSLSLSLSLCFKLVRKVIDSLHKQGYSFLKPGPFRVKDIITLKQQQGGKEEDKEGNKGQDKEETENLFRRARYRNNRRNGSGSTRY
jgi:hypothetical protein